MLFRLQLWCFCPQFLDTSNVKFIDKALGQLQFFHRFRKYSENVFRFPWFNSKILEKSLLKLCAVNCPCLMLINLHALARNSR